MSPIRLGWRTSLLAAVLTVGTACSSPPSYLPELLENGAYQSTSFSVRRLDVDTWQYRFHKAPPSRKECRQTPTLYNDAISIRDFELAFNYAHKIHFCVFRGFLSKHNEIVGGYPGVIKAINRGPIIASLTFTRPPFVETIDFHQRVSTNISTTYSNTNDLAEEFEKTEKDLTTLVSKTRRLNENNNVNQLTLDRDLQEQRRLKEERVPRYRVPGGILQ